MIGGGLKLYMAGAPTQFSTRTYRYWQSNIRFARTALLPFLLGRILFCLVKCPGSVMMQIIHSAGQINESQEQLPFLVQTVPSMVLVMVPPN